MPGSAQELTGGGMGTRPSGAECGGQGFGEEVLTRRWALEETWRGGGGEELCELGHGGGVWC